MNIYLFTAQQLAEKSSTTFRTIATSSKDSVLLKVFTTSVHLVDKNSFVWERIETEMLKFTGLSMDAAIRLRRFN